MDSSGKLTNRDATEMKPEKWAKKSNLAAIFTHTFESPNPRLFSRKQTHKRENPAYDRRHEN